MSLLCVPAVNLVVVVVVVMVGEHLTIARGHSGQQQLWLLGQPLERGQSCCEAEQLLATLKAESFPQLSSIV